MIKYFIVIFYIFCREVGTLNILKKLCFQQTSTDEKTNRKSKLISPKVKVAVVKTPITKSLTSLKDVSKSKVIFIL